MMINSTIIMSGNVPEHFRKNQENPDLFRTRPENIRNISGNVLKKAGKILNKVPGEGDYFFSERISDIF